MRIRVLRNLGKGLPGFSEGQEVDVDEKVAGDLCGQNLAELIAVPPTPSLKAVPPRGSKELSEASAKRPTKESTPDKER